MKAYVAFIILYAIYMAPNLPRGDRDKIALVFLIAAVCGFVVSEVFPAIRDLLHWYLGGV